MKMFKCSASIYPGKICVMAFITLILLLMSPVLMAQTESIVLPFSERHHYLLNYRLEETKAPLIMENDRDALTVCMMTVGLTPYAEQKIMRIKNTLYLDEVDVSVAYAPELKNRNDLEIIEPARSLVIERDGYFTKFLEVGKK